MKCPRCSAPITVGPDAAGYIICGGCGARLRSKSAAAASRSDGLAATPAPMPESLSPVPTPAPAGGPRDNETPTIKRAAVTPPGTPAPMPSAGGGVGFNDGAPVARKPGQSGSVPRPSGAVAAAAPVIAAVAASETGPSLAMVLQELKAIRAGQDKILRHLMLGASRPGAGRGGGGGGGGGGMGESMGSMSSMGMAASMGMADAAEDEMPAPAPPAAAGAVRARRRKTVLLIDDDEASRNEALAALTTAEVPTRAVSDGNAGLAAIAEQKPDVIVLELDVSGSMAGKDVVNMIKATMEWVDIPIVLFTRVPIESQKEARTIHGADDFVLKASGAAEQLVARVIQIFRRG